MCIRDSPNTVGDLSCLVTGVLIAFNIPVAAPLWLSAFGALFGIIVVKMLFGGIGKNFMNPALGARAFMMASWAGFMTTWTAPHANLPLFGNVTVTDAISTDVYKRQGQNFAFCAQFSRFCEKCKPEREYLHPFKLTEPERYSQRKSG